MVLFSVFLFLLVSLLSIVSPIRAETIDDSGGYADIPQLTIIFSNVVSVVAVVGGFLALIALIAGGFKFIIARGDPKALASAQSTIMWALIGLGLIIISWLLLQFIAQFTGLNVTTFCIPTPTQVCD